MSHINLTILGCGSAVPTKNHFNSSQYLTIGDKHFLIDCGEGAQIRMRQLKLKTAQLNHIFISHLHGDHCFGLIGLISTFALLGRTNNLYIHAHADLEKLLRPQIDYFSHDLTYEVIFNHINPRQSEIIYEDKAMVVKTIPLKHGVPTCGFLFEEKDRDRHLIKEKIAFYKIPVKELQYIKRGADFVTPEGKIIPNNILTKDPEPAKKYAYCTDTAYSEKIIPIIQGADYLFHEATFCEAEIDRAKATEHSTAKQAASIAKQANVGKLLIGHYSARYPNTEQVLSEAKEVFENTVACEDGQSFEI